MLRHNTPSAAPSPAPADSPRRTSPGEIVAAFHRAFGRPPAVVVRAPGRVNLLGAHVDYSDGWVMPAAVDRAVYLAAAPAVGRVATLHALDAAAVAEKAATVARLDLDRLPPPVPERSAPAGWSDLPAGVTWALCEAGHRPAAIDAVFAGDVPIGAGMSSSAAVEVAFLLAWQALAEGGAGSVPVDRTALAQLGRRAENGYLGVHSGVMDQLASLCGAAGSVLLIDCRELRCELLPLPAGAAIVVADSGVRRRLASSGFNDRRRQCAEAVELFRRHLPPARAAGIRALRDVTADDFALASHHLSPELRRRARHALEEGQRVHAGAAALRRSDLAAFGRLMRWSQLSSRDLYEVSTPELDALAAAAWAVPGCYGARLAGGGFGGCMTALVEEGAVAAVSAAMAAALRPFLAGDHQPPVFVCRPADGARILPPAEW